MEIPEKSYLGNGVSFPFERGASDLQTLFGEDLVLSSVPYILLTRSDGPNMQGEQPWDTGFGSQLERLKHSSLDQDSLKAFAEFFIVEALAINEPRLIVDYVDVEKKQNDLKLEIFVSVVGEDVDANDVRIQPGSSFSLSLPF